jgi:hypothetical protein
VLLLLLLLLLVVVVSGSSCRGSGCGSSSGRRSSVVALRMERLLHLGVVVRVPGKVNSSRCETVLESYRRVR